MNQNIVKIMNQNIVKMKTSITTITAIAGLALGTNLAEAATISVENSGGFVVGGPVSNTRTQAFNAGADADYLIVSTGGDTRDITYGLLRRHANDTDPRHD
jgi:hypothetical protein